MLFRQKISLSSMQMEASHGWDVVPPKWAETLVSSNVCTHTFQRNTQNQYIFGVRNRFHDCLLKCPMKTWQDISSFSSFPKAPHIKFLALVTLHSHHDSHDTFEKRFKFLFIGYSGFKFCFGFYHGNIQEEPYCNNCWGMLLDDH